jgi:tetratricopeptide (TPR) repeat protein
MWNAPATWANVGELDVRPAWQTTASLGRTALSGHVLFGTGPGSFAEVWAKNMPPEISQTAFWQTDFSFGIGLVPTSVITTGLLGAIAWLLFFVVFLWNGVKGLVLARSTDRVDLTHYLRITSFLSAMYLWAIAVIQVPSPVLLVYASILTGLFIASLGFGGDAVKHMALSFRDNPRVGFGVTLALTLAVLLSIGGVYGLTTRIMGEYAFERAVQVGNTSADIDGAEALALRAVQLDQVDVYYRLLSTLQMVRIQQLLAQNKAPDEIRDQFQALLGRAIGYAQDATTLEPNNYQNWLTLATVYQSVAPLGIDGTTDSAIAAFDRTLELRPSSPFVYLAKSALERARGNTDAARTAVEQAIALRSQYTDAIFLLAQMQLEQNDVQSAITSVQSVTLFDPSNPVAFFQLGLLYYGSEQYASAAAAFGRAVALNDVYANAHYFLGLADWRLGNRQGAIDEFKKVQTTNPDSAEVTTIIANLEAGRDPFVAVATSPDIKDLQALPVAGADTADQVGAQADTKNLSE